MSIDRQRIAKAADILGVSSYELEACIRRYREPTEQPDEHTDLKTEWLWVRTPSTELTAEDVYYWRENQPTKRESSKELIDALKYARRFLRHGEHDTLYVDEVLRRNQIEVASTEPGGE